MGLIKKKVEFTGDKNSVLKDATIDSGAEINVIDESMAIQFGCTSTGKSTTVESYDGNKTKADICKGRVRIPETCCDAETEFAVVSDEICPIIGNNFISETGMRIDGSKKDESNVSCDCGKSFTKLRDKLVKQEGNK